jgi:hypothetical protein
MLIITISILLIWRVAALSLELLEISIVTVGVVVCADDAAIGGDDLAIFNDDLVE